MVKQRPSDARLADRHTARSPATVAFVPVATDAPEGPHTCRGEVRPLAMAKSGAKSVMWSLCKCDKKTCIRIPVFRQICSCSTYTRFIRSVRRARQKGSRHLVDCCEVHVCGVQVDDRACSSIEKEVLAVSCLQQVACGDLRIRTCLSVRLS